MRIATVFLTIALVLSSCGGSSLSKNAVASTNGECPADHAIKGNKPIKGEWIFHVPGDQYYNRTSAEECFAIADDAIAAGYRASKR